MKFLKYILLLVNVGVASLLLFSYLSHFFNPQNIWYFELISLGYPYYMFLNVGFIVFWLLSSSRRFAFVSTITIFLGFSTFFDSFAFSGKDDVQTKNENSISVVSYNVMAFNYKGWKKRIVVQEQVLDYLKEKEPEIVCFQEFHYDKFEKFNIVDSIKRQLKLRYMHVHKVHEIKGQYFYGNVLFSKYPIIKSGKFVFQNTGNSTIWVDIVKNNDTIRIYNNHLESYRFQPDNIQTIEQVSSAQEFESTKMRGIARKLKQAVQKRGKQTNELVASMEQCKHNLIMCGDFNSPPYSYSYHALKSSKNLKDAFLESGSGIGGTYNWKLPSKRLDYILFSPDFESIDYECQHLQYSDHFPIFATIQVGKADKIEE